MDSIIRGYVTHSTHGWSIHLIGAIWSSMTHLIHLGGRKSNKEASTDDPVTEVLVQPKHNDVGNKDLEVSELRNERTNTNFTREYDELNKYLSTAVTRI
ncbi:hypothetical protein EAI_10398 [Harpegnathos saltator]|uniref:Uncharacterized protein n=1 Tax=Harpegnathos saltator TaxID=610380 RepID=E2BLB0_HARSA|nr:hypothetical protein EAI_10398 [Harpegnathos saltator]